MRHWTLLAKATIPGSERELLLHRGKDDYHISIAGAGELMNSRRRASEDALGALACRPVAARDDARVLIGGLGMGFTLAAALAELGPGAEVTVAELIPEVVEWNRGELGAPSGYPLRDPRTRVHVGDVAALLRASPGAFDAIALDVDNGPEGLTSASNDWLYSDAGIAAAARALRPEGRLAYWSAGPDRRFSERLRHAGLVAEEHTVRAHGKRGPRHVIWVAR